MNRYYVSLMRAPQKGTSPFIILTSLPESCGLINQNASSTLANIVSFSHSTTVLYARYSYHVQDFYPPGRSSRRCFGGSWTSCEICPVLVHVLEGPVFPPSSLLALLGMVMAFLLVASSLNSYHSWEPAMGPCRSHTRPGAWCGATRVAH